jgi:hypothetical protein
MQESKVYRTVSLTEEQYTDVLNMLIHYSTRPHMEHEGHENCAKKIATLISKFVVGLSMAKSRGFDE